MFFSRKPQDPAAASAADHPLDFADTESDMRLLDLDNFGDGWLGVESTHPLTWVPGAKRREQTA